MARYKLTEDEAEEIRIDLREGVPFQTIANEWNISTVLVKKINYGLSYNLDGYYYPVRRVKKKDGGLRMAGDDED